MSDEAAMPDPVEMLRKTTLRVKEVVAGVEQSQAQNPTPMRRVGRARPIEPPDWRP